MANDFDRALYAEIVRDVRKWKTDVKLRDAYVMKVGRDHWEFRYAEPSSASNNFTKQPEFYWHGRAGSAFDARARGWTAWLEREKGGTDGQRP